MTLVVAVGLRGDYLLVSIGSSTDVLARLGQGKHLAERPELAPLQKFAGNRLTGVDYLSQAMSADRQQQGEHRRTVEDGRRLAAAGQTARRGAGTLR